MKQATQPARHVRQLLAGAVLCVVAATAAIAQTSVPRAEQPQMKVGDQWRWERSDRRTGVKDADTKRVITAVSAAQIDGTENNSKLAMSADLMILESSAIVASQPVRFVEYPLEVGKKWEFKWAFTGKASNAKVRWQAEAEVTAYEKVKVPAGEFDSFKIDYKGYWNNDTTRANGRLRQTSWYAPAAKTFVKTEFDDGYNSNLTHLVEVQVQP
jgi:hypothetical protein